MGPWGNGYQTGNKDIYELEIAPLRLESIIVHHSSVIEALGFSYRDRENRPHTAGPWGKVTPGHDTTVSMHALLSTYTSSTLILAERVSPVLISVHVPALILFKNSIQKIKK